MEALEGESRLSQLGFAIQDETEAAKPCSDGAPQWPKEQSWSGERTQPRQGTRGLCWGKPLHKLVFYVGTSVSRARVVTFCANVVLAHGDEHHAGGKGGQKELKGLMQPLSPADSCLLQPSSLHIDCLAVASESANLRKWYRPNFQAGRYKMSAYPKSF